MNAILAAMVVASSMVYEAQVPTFGCTSIEDVLDLQRVRSDDNALQMALIEKKSYGECTDIPEGTVVDGSLEPTNSSMLLVTIEKTPPPFEAPLGDFKLKPSGK